MVPTTKVPAVIAAKSVDATEKVLPVPPTLIALAPLGSKVTVPLPALTVPEKATSFAVIEIAEFVDEMLVEPAFVTLPVPSVVMATPVVPVPLALRAIVPLLPAEVDKTSELPDNTWLAVRFPLAVSVKVPLVDVIAPAVVILAEAPVVVIEKLPPMVDAPIAKAPVLDTNAVPGLALFAVNAEAAVNICVPTVPMSPVADVRLTVPVVRVTAPDLVMSPEPLALTLIVPDVPVETLALMAMFVLPAVVLSDMMPLPLMVSAVGIDNAASELKVILPEVSLIVP